MHIIDSILAFAAYFLIGFAMVICFMFIYARITTHNEWQLIRENNLAAALAFGGTVLGYVIPLASAAINSVSVTDFLVWGAVALVVQLLIYGCVLLYMPGFSNKITNRNLAAGVFMGTSALAGGVLNAACMTW